MTLMHPHFEDYDDERVFVVRCPRAPVRQDAIYHVNHDELSLAYCEEEIDIVHVGKFRDRIDWMPG